MFEKKDTSDVSLELHLIPVKNQVSRYSAWRLNGFVPILKAARVGCEFLFLDFHEKGRFERHGGSASLEEVLGDHPLVRGHELKEVIVKRRLVLCTNFMVEGRGDHR